MEKIEVSLVPAKEIMPSLVVGDHIIFNGDGNARYPAYLLGHIYSVSPPNRLDVERDDEVKGRGISSMWWFSNVDRSVRIGKLPRFSTRVDFDSLAPLDIVEYFNGESAIVGIVTNVLPGKLITLQSLALNPESLAIHVKDADVLNYLGTLKSYKCGYMSCDADSTIFFRDAWLCQSHLRAQDFRASTNPEIFCRECGRHVIDSALSSNAMDKHLSLISRSHIQCPTCYKRRESLTINNYSYKPIPRFFFDKRPPNKEKLLYLGVENEMECSMAYSPEVICKKLLKEYASFSDGPRWFYFKSDGTINHGMELVTEPVTLLQHKKLPWRELFRTMKDLRVSSDINRNTGLHIHANKSFMSLEEQMKLGIFINTHPRESQHIARRTSTYASFIEILDYNSPDILANRRRYSALNWLNARTVEFRIFKGTVILKHLYSALEYVDSSIRFIKLPSVTINLLKSRRKCWDLFIEFLDREQKIYSNLIRAISDNTPIDNTLIANTLIYDPNSPQVTQDDYEEHDDDNELRRQ